MRQVVSRDADLLDRFTVVVDPAAEPFDLDGFLNILDQIVERRLSQRKQSTSGGTPATDRSIITTGE